MPDGKYKVYATDENDSSNNMIIECYDLDDMNKYAIECKKQGYTVVTVVNLDK